MSKSVGAVEVKRQGMTKTFDDYVTFMPHMWFYVCTFYSWGFKVIKIFNIVYTGSVSSFVKFGGQTSMTFKRLALKWPCVSMYGHFLPYLDKS